MASQTSSEAAKEAVAAATPFIPAREASVFRDGDPPAQIPREQSAAESVPAPETPAAAPAEKPASTPEPEQRATPDVGESQDRWAKRFEELSAKDAEVRAREQALKASEREMEQIRALKSELQSNPATALQKLGLTFDDIVKRHLNEGKADPLDETAKLQKQLEAQQKEFEEYRRAQSGQQRAREWEAELQRELKKDEWELARAWGAEDEASALAAAHFEQTGNLLTPDVVLSKVSEKLHGRLKNLKGNKSFMKLLELAINDEASPLQPVEQTAGRVQKTLTPDMGGTVSRFDPNEDRESRMARIAAKFG